MKNSENKKEAPQINPQDKNINIHKTIISENCGFVKRELFRAQGFPENYIIDHDSEGRPYPKSKQVARCGNAVTPPVPCALVRANLPEMCGGEERAAG